MNKNFGLRITFLFLLSSFTIVAFSQKKKSKMDYLVTNKSDTLYGKFKKSLFGALRFVSNDETYELDPTLFKAYYDASEKKVYERKMVNEKPIWLTCIENGRIRLYEQFYNTTQADGRFLMVRIWLAEKEGIPLQEIYSSTLNVQRTNGKQNLEYLVRDNPALFTKLQASTVYSYKVAKAYIEAYNQSWGQND